MNKLWKKCFGFLQSLSKSLMIPITFIPAAALLLGLSYWFSSFETLANYLNIAGTSILTMLPYIFIASVTYGMSKDKDGIIVIVSIIALFILTEIALIYNGTNLNNQFTAIILGLIIVYLFSYLRKVKMINPLIFFEGKRFATISVLLITVFLSFPIAYIFKGFIPLLHQFGSFINKSKYLSPFMFGTTSRLLIPTGMHHIWHNLFWFDTLGINAMPNYLLGINGANYLAGLFPIMLFGLPGAALAIIHTSRKKNRKSITILMTTAILSSVILGITEPIEFSFLFVSPLLFLFHALMTGLSMIIVNMLNIVIGFSFSAGLLDLLIQVKNPLNDFTKLLLLLPVGLGFGIIYYVFFRFLITKFNLLTPGRTNEEIKPILEGNMLANKMIQGLGGNDNIVNIDHCATRLRLTVKDNKLINSNFLKEQGALSVLIAQENVQIVIGPEVEGVADFMKIDTINTNIVRYKMPIKGKSYDISKTPDKVFSEGLIGPGFMIYPEEGSVTSPVDGTVSLVYPTKHAIAITTNNGIDIMIHFGIDTVELEGHGFEMFVKVGDKVNMGDLLMNVDLKYIKDSNKDLSTPIVFVQKENINVLNVDNDIYTIEVL